MRIKPQKQTIKFAKSRAARLNGVVVVQFEGPGNTGPKRAGTWVR